MNLAIAPPPRRDRQAFRRIGGRGIDPERVLLEHIEDLRHADDHRDAPLAHAPDDVVRIEAAHEHHGAVDERRDVRGHRLPEHVAQRQQVQEADRRERPRVFLVLVDLLRDRDRVREDVAMADDDALGSAVAPEVNTIWAMSSRLIVIAGTGPSADQSRSAMRQISVLLRPGSTSSPANTIRASTMARMRSAKSRDER